MSKSDYYFLNIAIAGLFLLIWIAINFWHYAFPALIIWLLMRLVLFYGYLRRKISAIEKSDVVAVTSKNKRVYFIPVKVFNQNKPINKIAWLKQIFLEKWQWQVKTIRPELNNDCVELVEFFHQLQRISVINKNQRDRDFQVMQQISTTTKDLINKINLQIVEFESKRDELQKLENLARSSDVYSQQAHLYSRAKIQIQELIVSGEKLRDRCLKFIKETLIGAELSKFSPETLPDSGDWQIEFADKYQLINEKYQNLKEEIKSYSEIR